ncbi:MAG TPA: preprotein translocase subunit SecE [Candidatus Avimonoglobus intestinipullorum]|uniref:Protein translocase subunit SecE n=1 Tax=Candidatus Avimonoglobus intestinipullorum TaxID=2840699 RepID=A0A9D1LU79_9FIRM|nr:preprotein translocase subunit SecE [Candidatus Avimonoglobus intestinipullorum]
MADNSNQTAKKAGLFARLGRFFKETKSELKKVTWPNREQLIHNTVIILVFIIIMTIILSVLDFGFAKLFQWLTSLF